MGVEFLLDDASGQSALNVGFCEGLISRPEALARFQADRAAARAPLEAFRTSYWQENPLALSYRRLRDRRAEVEKSIARLDADIARLQDDALAAIRDGEDPAKISRKVEGYRGERNVLANQLPLLETALSEAKAKLSADFQARLAELLSVLREMARAQADLALKQFEMQATDLASEILTAKARAWHLSKRADLTLPPPGE
jgi:hypothetical protein